ncbi:MAG: hypothetical protein KDH92_15215 [Chloroflexi bacterium]|nr:hypothetical protein [Chloroflexota bacterium]
MDQPRRRYPLVWLALIAAILLGTGIGRARFDGSAAEAQARAWHLVAWSAVGMHGMDADYSVYAIQPPRSDVYAQLMDPAGGLVDQPGGFTVTYEAVADPSGSINSRSADKSDFWLHARALFDRDLPVETGLAGSRMPGAPGRTEPMRWNPDSGTWAALGIPITPLDDAGARQPYPIMRLIARDVDERLLASADVVLPVSDEIGCASCHGSGKSARAEPAAGWVQDADPERDYRLNILRLHDERQVASLAYRASLAARGYRPEGLEATVRQDGKAILCAGCHASEPLATDGRPGSPALSQAMHTLHARERDPETGLRLDDIDNRQACYRCHPGNATQHLRGVMGQAVAASGGRAIQCESCHGSLRELADAARRPWIDEPDCGSCHTGTATQNAGEIRYTTVWDAGQPRQPVHPTFANQPDRPVDGVSLYRSSTGHGDLYCAACHGPSHAEYPSREGNDNLQAAALQGHVGSLGECAACHGDQPRTVDGGPHGMHPTDADWAHEGHVAPARRDLAACQACHGRDDRGTVLSRSWSQQTLNAGGGMSLQLWRGFQVGCYGCHEGPRTERRSRNRPAQAEDGRMTTHSDRPATLGLRASDPDGNALELRIVSQPGAGTVGLDGNQATYYPAAGWTGTEQFTFAAWDGAIDSNLARVEVVVLPAEATPTPVAGLPTPTSPGGASPSPTASSDPPPTRVVAGPAVYLPMLARGR